MTEKSPGRKAADKRKHRNAGNKASNTRKEREGNYKKRLEKEKRRYKIIRRGYPDFFVCNIKSGAIEFHEVKPDRGRYKLEENQKVFIKAILKKRVGKVFLARYNSRTNKYLERRQITLNDIDKY